MNSPYCQTCPNSPLCDKEHYFCSCVKVASVWNIVKQKVIQMIGVNIADFALINLTFPKCSMDNEIVWLLGQYIGAVCT